jgi:hypothetical protein
MARTLQDIAADATRPVESRMIIEYGAVFLTKGTPPPTMVFRDSEQVEEFQSSLATASDRFGPHQITLQTIAIDALKNARDELVLQGLDLSARAADSGSRSFDDTVRLWTRNVSRGLDHWERTGRLKSIQADAIRELPAVDQVAPVLELEEREQIYFSTFFDKSILYSVAAPGASQHLSLLAFDVAEFQDYTVERKLHQYGWFRTVIEDYPHFTYLGYSEDELPGLGLKKIVRSYQESDCTFWIPDL